VIPDPIPDRGFHRRFLSLDTRRHNCHCDKGLLRAEGMGFEPTLNSAVTGNLPCGCVICDECRAANALQSGRPTWFAMASVDADLHRVIASWPTLPGPIRAAMMALVATLPPIPP
jgi:hypothetical protein